MGKLYSLISALLLTVSAAFAAAPDSYEWWFDHDVSSAQSGTVSDGKVDIQIDTSDLPKGIHYFNLRLAEGDSIYGSVYRKLFHAFGPDTGAISYEYWYDHDFDAKVTGDISKGSNTLDLDVSLLSKGIHYFNCRLGYGDGSWGAVYRRMFHTIGPDSGAISYEYWYDSDYDSKVTGSIDIGANHFVLDISSLPPGAHYYNIRLGYGDGSWGSVYRKMVLNLAGNVNAVAYEYWIDNDYSAKTEGSLSPGANTYEVDLTGVRRGLHKFNYRLMTGEGVWGAPFTSYFYSASNEARFTHYEYWLDNDYANHVTGNATGNPTGFEVDLSGFDKSGGAHYFNLRTRDDNGDWSPIYRKLLVFNKTEKRQPIIGYRHYLNGDSLGYVEVERQFVDSYMFEVNLPDSLYPSVKNRRPSFDGNKVFIAGADSLDYTMQVRTELGWAAPQKWKLGVSNDFSTMAVAMEVNSRHTFAVPSGLEFAAMKFTSTGDSLYFRSDVPVALDIYKAGERVAALTPEQLKDMSMLKLTAGEYFGVLYGVESTEAKDFTMHLMDTPNQVPMPHIEYKDEMIDITCSRTDAIIRYTTDGNDPDEKSEPFGEPFPMKRNGVVKAKAWVEGSDIEPSSIAEYTVDSYKTAAPVAEFDLAKRLLTLKSETKDATILYTYEYDPADSVGGVWTDYENPIQIRKNRTVYSRATFDGYNDSDITVTAITTLPDSVPMPKIVFEKGMVTITCAEKDAEIHYTLDGKRPTAESILYDGAFPLRRNATVKAFAFVPGLDIDSSKVATHVVDSYKVNAPVGKFDVKSRLLTISCDTIDATISYAFERTGEWLPYSEPIRLRKNRSVYAKAALEGYNDSDVAEIVVSELPNEVLPPEITCTSGLVEIRCDTEDARIRYSLGDVDPTMESPIYEKAFTITVNTRVNAFAYVEDLDLAPSSVSSELFDIFKVDDLHWDFNSESRELTIGCDTEGAKILYTFNPDGEWTEYTGPILIRKNCTLYAKGVRDGYYDSKTETITINSLEDSVPVPEISFAGGLVTISCTNDKAEIHYTVDDEDISVESPKYTAPFRLERNATVRAFALIPGLDIEPSETVTYVVDSYKVEKPTGVFNSETRQLTLTCSTKDARIFYSFVRSGDGTEYSGPISITKNCTVYAQATLDGYNDSDIAEIPITALANSVASPSIDFKDGTVTITCASVGAEIHYTIDDEDLTVESPLYTGPFRLDRNATIRAFALIPGLDIEPSGVTTEVVNSYKVKAPTGSFDADRRELTLSCGTDGARIFYSFAPDGDWTEYTGPISITRNCTVYAKATLEGWNDSEVAPIRVTALAESVFAPEIEFKDGTVTITCASEGAEIHYTIDDENLTVESPLYTGPFRLDRNATIRAFALIPGLDIEPSGVTTEVVNSYKVNAPTGSFDADSRMLTLSCGTDGARIFYSFASDGDWTEYTGPISITRNCTVYAKATLEGWNDSEVAPIRVTALAESVFAPEIDFKDGTVTITCDSEGAEIHYTIDDPDLTAESPVYTGPFRLDRNATIRAFALIPGLDIEPSGVTTEVVDYYKVATPYGEFDATSRLLTILCDTESASILYSFSSEGEWLPYSTPVEIEANGTVFAMATRDGYNDSDVAEIEVSDMKCAPVTISYNGRYVSLETSEPDAVIKYSTDGVEPSGGIEYSDPIDIEGICTVRAVAVKSGYMNSDVVELAIGYYSDIDHAVTSTEGQLASAFEWDVTALRDDIESFSVEGRLNADDYAFLSSMKSLRHLDIENVADAHLPENAFRNSRLVSISLPADLTECGDSILSGSSNLCSVIWNSTAMNVGTGLTRGLANPNVLLYVPEAVTVTGPEHLNTVRGEEASSVTLRYGYPYYAVRDFQAKRVSLTHEFLQTTKVDTCRGWETIVLPFEPTGIIHAVNGQAVPFAAWDRDIKGDKPFWLYSATSTGWIEAGKIEARVPYIISMPNNPDYVDEFNLGGKVTFSAENVRLGPESSMAFTQDWKEGTKFEGTFLPVEESGLLSLNVNAPEDPDIQPGSTFVPDAVTVPFGAFVRGASGRKAMPLFGGPDTDDLPLLIDPGLAIETPSPGVLKICSGRERRVAVTTVTGVTLHTLRLHPGESVTIEGLTRDLYIVAGRKVMVR